MLIVLLVVGGMMLLCCGGVAVMGSLAFAWTKTDLQRMQASIRARPQPAQPVLIAPRWQSDWVAMSQLTPFFTAALDAVTTDKQVIERLGTPVEPTGDSDSLFRRERTGQWTGADETIEFDIQGPKSTATVRVRSAAPQVTPGMPGRYGLNVGTITVTLADGTEINVAPPAKSSEPEP